MIVAFAITALVYGVVGLIVKMDDVGLKLAKTREGAIASFGRGLVRGMPIVLSVLSTVGIAAMLWVGGHILLVGIDELGFHAPYDEVHHLEEDVDDALGAVGGVGAWLTNTAASAILGLVGRRDRRRDHAPPPPQALAHLGQRHGVGAGGEAQLAGLVVDRAPHGLGDIGRGRGHARCWKSAITRSTNGAYGSASRRMWPLLVNPVVGP